MNISITLRRGVIALAVLGTVFATTAFADPPFSTNESWSSCTEAPPQGPKGLTVPGVGAGTTRPTHP